MEEMATGCNRAKFSRPLIAGSNLLAVGLVASWDAQGKDAYAARHR